MKGVESTEFKIVSPVELRSNYPAPEAVLYQIDDFRRQIRAILDGEDSRLLVVMGPCSVSDTEDALVYAEKLAALADRVKDKVFLVMRTYFEKPRTTLGWKGLLYDPFLDDSYDIGKGLEITRKLLLEITKLGVPCATEFLSSHVPKYIGDLISYAAIGARTSESQGHREFSSRLSMPVGFKNGVSGSVRVAINGILSGKSSHSYLGVGDDGGYVKVVTPGNPYCHMILRGGSVPNYDAQSVASVCDKLESSGLVPQVMIDCSHGNSGKDFRRQGLVFRNVLAQRVAGDRRILGMMLESNLCEGSQEIDGNGRGVSRTDECIGWEETERLILEAYENL